MKVAIAFACLIAAVCSTVSNPINIVPAPGKEHVYHYNSTMYLGTREPEEFGTGYKISSNLHVNYVDENSISISLTDVLYKIMNGQYKLPITPPTVPIPMEAKALTYQFIVNFDKSGQIKTLRFSPQDSEWSINMKKQIASLFQLNRHVLEENLVNSQSAYVLENSIYGECNVNYHVKPRGDDLLLVKLEDPSSCNNNLHLKESNAFLSTDKGKIYSLVHGDGGYKIQSIQAEGSLIVHPKGIKNENGLLLVLQNLRWKETVEAMQNDETYQEDPKNQILVSSLKFNDQTEKCRDVPLQSVLDLSGGRHVVDSKLLLEKLNILLEDVIKYFDQNQVTLMKPEMKNVNLINRILAELQVADLPLLEQFFALLSEKTKSETEMRKLMVFIELLPYIGTRPSAILIRNLIRKNKIDNEAVIQRVLANLPDQVQCPTEKLLYELEDMLTFKDDNTTLYEVALLSYASLIRRTFVNFDEKSAALEKYITIFAEKYQQTDDMNQKILFLECLGNIEIGSVFKRLMVLLKTETHTQLRMKILRITMARLQEDQNLLLKEVWPLITNEDVDPDLRLMAYVVYVNVKQPSVNHFMKLFWLMAAEPSERIYIFHYNTLKSFAKNPEFDEHSRQLAEISSLILRLSRKPVAKNHEGIYIVEKLDPVGYSGVRAQFVILLNQNSEGIFGVEILQKLNEEVEEIGSLYGSRFNDSTHFISHKNGRTLNVLHIADESDPEQLMYQIASMLGGGAVVGNDTLETVLIPMNFEKVIPTELGVPVVLYDRSNQFLEIKFELSKLDDFELDLHIKTVETRSLGMKVYNPINDLWHGIQEHTTIATNIPINGECELKEDGFKLIMHSKSDSKYIFGAQYYVESQVFIENINSEQDRKLLSVGSGVAEDYVRVGREFAPLRNLNVYDVEIDDIGKRLKVAVFDCDRDISIRYVQRLIEKIDSKNKESFLDLIYFQPSLMFESGIGGCGIGIQLLPLENVNRLELEMLYEKTPYSENITSYERNETMNFGLSTISNENKTLAACKAVLMKPMRYCDRNIGFHLDLYADNENVSISAYFNATLSPTDMLAVLEVSFPQDEPGEVYEFSLHGMRSDEQKNTKHILSKQCKRQFYDQYELTPVSPDCYYAETDLRKYVFTRKVRGEIGNETSYEVTFPLLRPKEIDVKSTSDKEFLEGIPNILEEYHLHDLLPPVNAFFGSTGMDKQGASRQACIIGSRTLMKLNFMKELVLLTDDWRVYFKNEIKDDNMTIEVWAKKAASKVEGAMSFRMVYDSEVIECDPLITGFECKLDGTVLTDPSYTFMDQTKINRFFITGPFNMVLLQARGMGIFAAYDGFSIRLELKSSFAERREYLDSYVSGLCVA